MKSLTDKIIEAWKHRFKHDVEQAYFDYVELKQLIGIDVDVEVVVGVEEFLPKNMDQSKNKSSAINQNYAHIILLGSSIARAQRNYQKSDTLFELGKKICQLSSKSKDYFLQQETGIRYYIQGKFYEALESFINAKLQAPVEEFKLTCLTNALFCMDLLGISFQNTLNEIKSSSLYINKDPLFYYTIEQFEVRKKFQKGDFDSIFKLSQKNDQLAREGRIAARTDVKNIFFIKWLEGLPYHRYSKVTNLDLEELTKRQQSLYLGAFRLRTLQGILHPDDLININLQELIDRVYLWVWRWLYDPDSFHIKKIFVLVDKIDLSADSHRLTIEDKQMLTNALLWISLFGQEELSKIEKLLSILSPSCFTTPSSNFSLFEFERLFIHYFFALRDNRYIEAKDLLQSIHLHPLSADRQLTLPELIEEKAEVEAEEESVSKNLLNRLKSNLNRITNNIQIKNTDEYLINLNNSKIVNLKTNQETISRPMTLALQLLSQNFTVKCKDFLNYCFGLSNYNSFTHDTKIYNLISRIKSQFKSNLTLHVKSGMVVCKGTWENFTFYDASGPTKQIITYGSWLNLDSKLVTSSLQSNQNQNQKINELFNIVDQEVSRGQIEEIIDRPRSTVNRLLNKWIQDGLVEKKGKSRNTRYKFNELFKQKFQDGVITL